MFKKNLTLPARSDLRRACKQILSDSLTPRLYKQLAIMALRELGWTGSQADFNKLAEDIREQVLLARCDGMAYIPKPYCVGVIADWYSPDATLVNETYLPIPITVPAALRALEETHWRFPYMLNKSGSSEEIKLKRVGKGLLIENIVSEYFKEKWPDMWRPPENEGQYRMPCPHDFKIELPDGTLYRVDVAGKGQDDLYGTTVYGKQPADFHILAELTRTGALLKGVVYPDVFQSGRIDGVIAQPVQRLIARLNTTKEGYDFSEFTRILYGHRAA